MALLLKFKDETMAGQTLRAWTVPIVIDRITVREIIETRVTREVEKYNETCSDYYNGLVQPDETEVTLNGYKMNKTRRINPEEQCRKAIDGYKSNSYIILINNSQPESLDELIEIDENTEISFIKLIPLVGG